MKNINSWLAVFLFFTAIIITSNSCETNRIPIVSICCQPYKATGKGCDYQHGGICGCRIKLLRNCDNAKSFEAEIKGDTLRLSTTEPLPEVAQEVFVFDEPYALDEDICKKLKQKSIVIQPGRYIVQGEKIKKTISVNIKKRQ